VTTRPVVQLDGPRDLVGRLAESILEKRRLHAGGGFVVGVDGKGCSGKSRLARALVSELLRLGVGCVGASIDDFCNPYAVRYGPGIPEGLQVYHRNFDERTWIDEVIRPFHRRGTLRFDRVLLDPRSDSYTNRVRLELDSNGILVAEGLHLRKRAYRDLFDYSILLHITDETQVARALVRDAEERGKSDEEVRFMYSRRYVPSFRHYLREDLPCESVDVMIDYEHPDRPVLLHGADAERAACAP